MEALVGYSSSEAGSASPEQLPPIIFPNSTIQEGITTLNLIPSNNPLSLRISGSAPMSATSSTGSNSNSSSNSVTNGRNNSISIKNSFQQQQQQQNQQQQRNNESISSTTASSSSLTSIDNQVVQTINQSITEVPSTPSFLSRLSFPLDDSNNYNNNSIIKSSPTFASTSYPLPPLPSTSSLNTSSNSRLRDSLSSLDAEGEIDSEEEDKIVGVGNSIPGTKRETLALNTDPFRRRSSNNNDSIHANRPTTIMINTISPTSTTSNLPSTSIPSLPTSTSSAPTPTSTTTVPPKREKFKLTNTASNALNIKGVAVKSSKPLSRNTSLAEASTSTISPSTSSSSVLAIAPIAVVEEVIVKEAPVEEEKVELKIPEALAEKAVEFVEVKNEEKIIVPQKEVVEEKVVDEQKIVEIPKIKEEQKVEVDLPPPVVVKPSLPLTSEIMADFVKVIKSPTEEGEILFDKSTTAIPIISETEPASTPLPPARNRLSSLLSTSLPSTSLPSTSLPSTSLPLTSLLLTSPIPTSLPSMTQPSLPSLSKLNDSMEVDEPEEGEVVVPGLKPTILPSRPVVITARSTSSLAERIAPLPQERSPTPPRPIRLQTPLSIQQQSAPYLSPADTRKRESLDTERRVKEARASREEGDKLIKSSNRSSSRDSNPSRYSDVLNYGGEKDIEMNAPSSSSSPRKRSREENEDSSLRRRDRIESINSESRASGSTHRNDPSSSHRDRSSEPDRKESLSSSRNYDEVSSKIDRVEEKGRARVREDEEEANRIRLRGEKRKATEEATAKKRSKSSSHDSPRRSSKHSSKKETIGEASPATSSLPRRPSSPAPRSPTPSSGSRDRGLPYDASTTDSYSRRKDSLNHRASRDNRSRSPTRFRSPDGDDRNDRNERDDRDDRRDRGYDDSRNSRTPPRTKAGSRSPPRSIARSRSPPRIGNNFDDRGARNYDRPSDGGGGVGNGNGNRPHHNNQGYSQYHYYNNPNGNNHNSNHNKFNKHNNYQNNHNNNNYHNNNNNNNNSNYRNRNSVNHYEPHQSFQEPNPLPNVTPSRNDRQPSAEPVVPPLPTAPALSIATSIPATIPLPTKPVQIQKEPPPRNKSISKPQAQIVNLGAQHMDKPVLPTGPKEKRISITFPNSKIPVKTIPKETPIPEEPFVHPTELLPLVGLPDHPSLIISTLPDRPPLPTAEEQFKLAQDQQSIKPWSFVNPGSSIPPPAELYSQSIPIETYSQPLPPIPSIPIPTLPPQIPVNPAFHRLISPNSASSSSAGPATPNNRTPQRELSSQNPPTPNKARAPFPPTLGARLNIGGWLEPPSNFDRVDRLVPKKDTSGLTERVYVGTSKIGEYTLQQKLGEGTFGLVYKGIRGIAEPNGTKPKKMSFSEQAREDKLIKAGSLVKNGDVVALKEIILHNAGDGMPITSLREIRILKSLKHPNIVPVVDIAFEEGDKETYDLGKTYMVFPYMEHDLTGLLENTQVTLKEEHIKQYAKQLLLGTQYLHKNGIIHRDIKAANLLISNAGVLMIADFGLARSLYRDNPGKQYTNCVVTRWYRPPELLLGETKYGTAVDMWGVGCVIAEMFKRTPILPGSSDLDQAHRIFELCGNPTATSMPGWEEMLSPEMKGITFKPSSNTIHLKYEQYGSKLVQLLKRFLVLDPKRRVTAIDALDDEWFWSYPEPTLPHKMPTYKDSHEFDKRLRDEAMNPSLHSKNQRPSLPAGNSYQPPQSHQPPPAYAPQPIYAPGYNQVPVPNTYGQNYANASNYQAPQQQYDQQQYDQQQRYNSNQGSYPNANYGNHGNNNNAHSYRGGGRGGYNNRNSWQSNGNTVAAAAGGGGKVNLANMLEGRPGGTSSSYGVPSRPSNSSQPPLDPRASQSKQPYDT